MAAMSMVRAPAVAALAMILLSTFQVQGRLGSGENSTSSTNEVASAAGSGAATGWVPVDFEEDLEKAALAKPAVFARGGAARGLDYWANASSVSAASVDPSAMYGYEYLATTTQYADTCCGSCGKVDTAAVVAGTGYYAVASAQVMQSHFHTGSCCWCGEAGAGCGHGSGTAPMGCSACAKGRFLPKRPYAQPVWGDHEIFHQEIHIVAADICPHLGNEAWCPQQEGTANRFGSKNHFDFARPPSGFDNFYFAFTPVPCSWEIQQRLASMSQCSR